MEHGHPGKLTQSSASRVFMTLHRKAWLIDWLIGHIAEFNMQLSPYHRGRADITCPKGPTRSHFSSINYQVWCNKKNILVTQKVPRVLRSCPQSQGQSLDVSFGKTKFFSTPLLFAYVLLKAVIMKNENTLSM